MIKLNQPKLLDFTKLRSTDNILITIENTQHKFATDAEYSGINEKNEPIFGSKVFINDELFTESTYGFPFIQFSKNSNPKITYHNKTNFTFNNHYHGLCTKGVTDGATIESIFGISTLLGPVVTFVFPKIVNNQSLIWYHSHNMFISMELINGGTVGLINITDKKTKWLSKIYKYQDNHILLIANDIDLTNTGTYTNKNLVKDSNRSCFSLINGISSLNWYSNKNNKFVNTQYHSSSKNLVKIDILNASLNWRVFHLGVCDINKNIKSFYLVQTDSGLLNPNKLEMTFIQVGSRVGIIIDLNDFIDNEAYLFFYDYDLTEIFNSSSTFPNLPNNHSLTGTVPIFKNKNSTPYPTPIPDPFHNNQQKNYTNLNYPKINLIEQKNEILENGTIKVPEYSSKKIFLKIIWEKPQKNKEILNIEDTLEKIKKTIFGKKNYYKYKNILSKSYFEYNNKYNYLSFLNKKYFYNIPNFDQNVPSRNILLFPENNINCIDSGNIHGTTEFTNGTNRIMVDLWNSDELDLNYALTQYNLSPNCYKPFNLPTSKFRIYKTNDQYSNTAMLSNDTLKIQFFNEDIIYGDYTTKCLKEITVIFSSTYYYLNIQELVDLINITFINTPIENLENYNNLGDVLSCDWSFFPYQYNYLYNKNLYIKSCIIKTLNKSNYNIRFLARWPLLQFFGKPLCGRLLNTISNNIKNPDQYIKCDEYALYGIYDNLIQDIYPFYATSDGNQQLPIACMRRDGELIISKSSTYIGLYDGYFNDNLNSFSVKLKSSELWYYNNGDNSDSHPLHMHLTSGYAVSLNSSPNLISYKNSYNSLIYSRDIYQIGPQETVAFYLTWPYYPSIESPVLPNIRGRGGMVHCHYLKHNDDNSMIIQYYVDSLDIIKEIENNNIENNDKVNKIEKICCVKK